MSYIGVNATRWAWAAPVASSSERLVLLALAKHADEDGSSFPSADTLAEETRLNRKTVFSALTSLCEGGLIVRSCRSGQGRRNQYELRIDSTENGTYQKRNDPKTERSSSQKRDFESTENGTSNVPNLGHEYRREERREQGREQGMFFVEPPSGGFDDAPPTLFDDETTEKVERSASRIPACPYKKLVDLYHEVCPMLPTVTVLTPGCKTQLKARWTEIYREEHCTSEAECMENFRFIFNRVAASRFLTGRTDPGPGRSRPFVANLDWLIKAANSDKVCENRYSN